MTKRPAILCLCLVATFLCHAAFAVGAEVPAGGAARTEAPRDAKKDPRRARYDALKKELGKIQEALPAKREELAKLRHKWVVKKGRTPGEKEITDFEKKKSEGKAKAEDNPFVNKSPLSSPAPARAAYYAKKEEIRQDEERARQISEELSLLEREAARPSP